MKTYVQHKQRRILNNAYLLMIFITKHTIMTHIFNHIKYKSCIIFSLRSIHYKSPAHKLSAYNFILKLVYLFSYNIFVCLLFCTMCFLSIPADSIDQSTIHLYDQNINLNYIRYPINNNPSS